MYEIDHAIDDLARTQLGLVTFAQLARLGLTPPMRRHRLALGRLRRLGGQVLVTGGAPPSFGRDVLAACLDTGGVASHRTAAALWRLGDSRRTVPVEVTVVRGRHLNRSPLARVHTTTDLPPVDVTTVDAIPVTTVARTLFGLAGLVGVEPAFDAESVADAVDAAVRDGLARDRFLWWRLEQLRARGRNGVSCFEAILARRSDQGPTESWLEREFLRLLRSYGLPLPACQRRIAAEGAFVARVDFCYEIPMVAVEVTGHRHHSTTAQRRVDDRRRNKLVVAGMRVLEFSYDEVVNTPAEVAGTVAAALGIDLSGIVGDHRAAS